MLTKRLQVLVEPEQYDRLERYAHERGTSVGEAVRDAIERVAGVDHDRRRAALARFLAAEDHDVPNDPAQLEAELDGMLDDDDPA